MERHLSNHVHVTHHPEWKSWWTFMFIHIPLINLKDVMSSKGFYKWHRWPLASSVLLLTGERNWISGERTPLASYINHAASFQVPESIWTIRTLPTSPNSCYTSFCMYFSFLSPVAMVILYGSTCLCLSWGMLTALAMLTFKKDSFKGSLDCHMGFFCLIISLQWISISLAFDSGLSFNSREKGLE